MEHYVEIIENSVHNRGNFVSVSELTTKKRDSALYTSVFYFDKSIVDYAMENRTENGNPSVRGFVGQHGMRYLWLDIDYDKGASEVDNMKVSASMASTIIRNAVTRFGLSFESFVIYYSGKKGFHIGIPSIKFGAASYMSDLTNKIAKTMALNIAGEIAIDTKVYDTTRIFRFPLSKHEKSGRYKVNIHYQTLLDGKVEKIMTLGNNCESDVNYRYDPSVSEPLTKLFEYAVSQAQASVDLFDGKIHGLQAFKENSSLFKVPQYGNRNEMLFKQAFRLFCMSLKTQEVKDIMLFIKYACDVASVDIQKDPISDVEFMTSINSAYSYTRLNSAKVVQVSSVEDRIKESIKSMMESKHVSTTFEDVDEDLNGGFELGNTYCAIGRGGTLKSFLTQIVCMKASRKGDDCMYINGEMTEKEFVARMISNITGEDIKKEIKDKNLSQESIESIYEITQSMFNSRFSLVSESDLTPEDIKGLVRRRETETRRKIQLVVIDSFASLKMEKDELSSSIAHSKKLKEIAKELNIAIVIISHANSMCSYHQRDCSPFVRGGTKMIDNCDSYFSMSKIINPELSNIERNDFVYYEDKFYFRFVNKRGSGKTFNKVLEIAGSVILESKINPAAVEIVTSTRNN